LASIFDKYRNQSAVLLLLLSVLLISNTAFNRHLHYYKGYTISHAHPYNKTDGDSSPVKSHHHSDAEFIIIDLITNVQVIAGFIIYLTTILILFREIGIVSEVVIPTLPFKSLQKNRAPPKLVLYL
jgi:hypothetical protein